MIARIYPNLFKSRYSFLSGRDWIKSIHPDDKKHLLKLDLSILNLVDSVETQEQKMEKEILLDDFVNKI